MLEGKITVIDLVVEHIAIRALAKGGDRIYCDKESFDISGNSGFGDEWLHCVYEVTYPYSNVFYSVGTFVFFGGHVVIRVPSGTKIVRAIRLDLDSDQQQLFGCYPLERYHLDSVFHRVELADPNVLDVLCGFVDTIVDYIIL